MNSKFYDNNIFANNLKNILQEKGKTKAELSRFLGVSKSVVSEYTSGKSLPRVDKIDRICLFLNCTREELIEQKEPQIDALEEDILLMFRKLDNRQKIALYNSIKIMCEAFERTENNG